MANMSGILSRKASASAVQDPNEKDVLCDGHGKTHLNHKGNITFRNLIDENAHKFKTKASTKTDRNANKKLVVDIIGKLGRFLVPKTRNPLTWCEMKGIKVKDKVRQALRDKLNPKKTPETKREKRTTEESIRGNPSKKNRGTPPVSSLSSHVDIFDLTILLDGQQLNFLEQNAFRITWCNLDSVARA